MQVTVHRRAGIRGASGSRIDCIAPGSERFEDRIQISHHFFLSTNHLAVTAFQTPDSSTRSDVHVVNAFGFQFTSAPDVVDIKRVSTVDYDIARSHERHKLIENNVDKRRRNHQPDRAWGLE